MARKEPKPTSKGNSNMKARYETTDTLGNRYTIIIRDNDGIIAHNQHRYPVSLSNFATGSKAEAKANISSAARAGLDALNAAGFMTWTQRD
jgi:hypothetical protein